MDNVERKMSADEARAKVLAVWPKATCRFVVVGRGEWYQVDTTPDSRNQLGHSFISEDAAWIDAAQRLPAEKEQPEKAVEGITDAELDVELRANGIDPDVLNRNMLARIKESMAEGHDTPRLREAYQQFKNAVENAGPAAECRRPPKGWRCTRGEGHRGPCAAVKAEKEQRQGDPRKWRTIGFDGPDPVCLPVFASEAQPLERLNMELINSLPQPLYVRLVGDKDFSWPLEYIDVETGLLKFDVCGKLQSSHIGDVAQFKDSNGTVHDAETFYSDWEAPKVEAQREEEPQLCKDCHSDPCRCEDWIAEDDAYLKQPSSVDREGRGSFISYHRPEKGMDPEVVGYRDVNGVREFLHYNPHGVDPYAVILDKPRQPSAVEMPEPLVSDEVLTDAIHVKHGDVAYLLAQELFAYRKRWAEAARKEGGE